MKKSTSLCAIGVLCAAAAGAFAAPVNDNMANALVVGAGTYSFDTSTATLDGPTYTCEAGPLSLGKDIWYRIHTLSDGVVSIATCGSSFDTSIAVYLGLTTTNLVGCNDQAIMGCPATSQSYLQFQATADTTYLINIGGFHGSGGTGQLLVSGPIAGLTSYTYQGRLTNGQATVNGLADMSFKLFNASEGGSQVGTTQVRSSVPVLNGVFSVVLNFDAPTVTSPLFIEPTINGVTLARQLMASAPVAVQAQQAQQAVQAQQVPWSGVTGVPASVSGAFSPWVKSGSDILYNAGDVGIGITPLYPLHVFGPNRPVAQLESSHTAGTWLNLSNTTAGGRIWQFISTGSGNGEGPGHLLIGTSTSPTSTTQVMALMSNGNVGIGTTAPPQKLTVNGNVLANNIGVPSSIRFKDHVVPLEDALESLMKLEGVRFDWKPEFAKERGFVSDVGFVAEDVEKVFPEIVLKDAEGNVVGMDYSRVTAVAVEAIKQLKIQHEREMGEMRERIEKLERAIEKAK